MAYIQKNYNYNDRLTTEENLLLDRIFKLKLSHMAEDDYSAPPAHSGRSSVQPDRASAHLIQSAVQPMLAADQHTC